jgi:SHS2 domain-containing protein
MDPLEQRTSGRRAQRRRQRQQEVVGVVVPASGEKRGPSDEMEKRIQQAIDERKQQFSEQSAAQLSSYEPDVAIDGTYEYLDHTADIQLHSWGDTLEEALEQLVVAMFGYKTQLNLVQVNAEDSAKYAADIKAEGHDLYSLIFAYLQEWLYVFHETGFLVKHVKIEHLDLTSFAVHSSGRGERADWSRHVQGTEIKAITYSNLQVSQDKNGQHHVWVIVDI